jgi:predicted PurR-regulated permease PerM
MGMGIAGLAVDADPSTADGMKVAPTPRPPVSPKGGSWRDLFVARESDLPQLSESPVAPTTVQRRHIALGVLLLLSFLAAARLAAPVWIGIVFGALMAFTAQSLYRTLTARLGGRRHTAALLTTMLTGSVLVVGGSLAVYVLTRELFAIIALLQHRLEAGTLAGLIGAPAVRIVERIGLNEVEVMRRIQDEMSRATTYATQAAGLVLQTTATSVVGLVIGCITMYCVLVDWPSIPLRLERVLPLDPHHTRALVLEFRDIGRSAIVGTMATAIFQGVVASIGYTISDLPHAVTWGLFTAAASFFPVLGTAIIWVPVCLYYVSRGQISHAVLQAVWGLVLVVGLGDYVLRPRLVGRKGKGHPLLMLVAALGGIQVFGLAGIVVGPVTMSLFLAILTIYEREIETSELSDLAATQPRLPMVPPIPSKPAGTGPAIAGTDRTTEKNGG